MSWASVRKKVVDKFRGVSSIQDVAENWGDIPGN